MPTVTVIQPTIQEQTGTKVRVAAYCRVSSSSDDQLNSYAAQVTYYTHKFENSDTEILADLYADEGITGTCDTKRMEFQRMITDCRRGRIDRIYTKSISRFARNTRDCLKYMRELKSLGITIFFEKENIDTAKVTDEMMITIMGGLAQEESVSISQNVRWSIKKRMENGTFISSSCPYGYDSQHGKMVINEAQAAIVRRIFEEFLRGYGCTAIANRLNAETIWSDKTGGKWHKNVIRYMLSNERYIGDSLWEKSYIEDAVSHKKKINFGERKQYYAENTHEPIISRETFSIAQRLLAERGKKFSGSEIKKYPLSMKIYCQNCGSSYKRKMIKHKVYWVCREHDFDSGSCPCKGLPEETIYAAFIKTHNKLLAHHTEILLPMQLSMQALHSRKFSGNVRVMDIYKEIAKLREQIHVLTKLRTKGFLNEAKYQEQTTEQNRKIHKLQKELQRLTQAEDENDILEQIDVLIGIFEKRKHLMVSFEPETFDMLINKIVASGQDKLEFQLIGGLNLTENIYVL